MKEDLTIFDFVRAYYRLTPLTAYVLTTDLPLTSYVLTTDLPMTVFVLTTDVPLTYH